MRLAGRMLLSGAVATAALLVAEGALSLFTTRSLLELTPWVSRGWTDADRLRAAARNRGAYRVHEDPYVGYVMRPRADVEMHETAVRTGPLGMRRRFLPQRAEDALRIVVLGDSVAFGLGVGDRETIAHELEKVLTVARGPDEPEVVCRTVAMPGWNHRNAVSYLLDHLDAWAPDVVVYMPIGNDLEDGRGVYESGHARLAPDVAQPDPLLIVNSGATRAFERELARQVGELEAPGAGAIPSDLSPESRRRFDENADSIVELEARLRRAGARLLIAHYQLGLYAGLLQDRLLERDLQAPTVWLLRDVPPELTLGFDPHPNARTLRIVARWIGDALMELGWVGDARRARLPQVGVEYEELRARAPSPAQVRGLAQQARRKALGLLQPVIDLTTGRGVRQLYGGLDRSGLAGPRLKGLLARGGPVLEVALAALPERPDLDPVEVDVDVDGRALGTITLTGAGARERLALPPGAQVVEVTLAARRWVSVERGGRRLVAAYRPLSLAASE